MLWIQASDVLDPERLGKWEVILQSDVAVALLLLGFALVLMGVLLTWARALHQENQQLKRELIDHLKADGELNLVRLSRLLDLYQRFDDRLDPAQDHDVPAAPQRG